jgi:hypothetical protein
MKILQVWWDIKSDETVEQINNFSEKERGVIIVSAGHVDMWRMLASELLHTLNMPLMTVDHRLLQQHEVCLDTILSQVSEDKRQDLVLKIEKMIIADTSLDISYLDVIRTRDIAVKKQQEKLRRKHYKQWKVSKKKKW